MLGEVATRGAAVVAEYAACGTTLWRWVIDQLPDRVIVLPQVVMTIGRGGRPEEAEADLVLVDPSFGVTVLAVNGRAQRCPTSSS